MTSDGYTNANPDGADPRAEGEIGPIDSDIRAAYSDLSARASNPAVAARATMPGRERATGSERGFRFLPPLVVVGVLAAFVGGGALLFTGDDDQQVETGPAETDQIDDTTDSTDPVTDNSDPDGEPVDVEPDDAAGSGSDPDSGQVTEPTDPVEAGTAGSRYRVAMELVAADTNDPYLNMRMAPGADSELLAKLPANYTGLMATGESVAVPDGGTWMEFTLLDAVPFTNDDPFEGLAPVGWANAAFVEFLPSGLPIGVDELAPCSGDGSFLGEAGSDSVAAAQSQADWYVYAMESGYVSDGCLRVVMTFGQGQAPLGGWFDVADSVGPASSTPSMYVSGSGGFGVTVELPGISSAAAQATETDNSTFLVRQRDGSLDLEMLLPSRGDSLSAFADRGIVVLDINIDAGTNGGLPPSNGRNVHLTMDPMLFDDGAVELVGIARPFEANLGVRVLDDDGNPVEAVFSGSRSWGTRQDSSYSVTVDDWIEAWGKFAIRMEGLAPGDYTIELEDDSGSDDAQPFRLPVTITGQSETVSVASEEEQAAALGLLSFADGGDIGSVPLADEVTLYLGAGEERQVRSSSELGNRDAWTFDAEGGLGGLSGPFNAVDTLSQPVGIKITAGPINHCANPPRQWPADLDGLRQVSIEPVGIDSCLAWSGVSLFLNQDGDIAAIVLDGWGP